MTTPSLPRSWLALTPETWRTDLLRIILRVGAVLGGIVYLPSVFFVAKFRMTGVVALDTAAIATISTLAFVERLPARLRAACACLIFYALGAGLMVGVGSISQIYLFLFSLLTTLLLNFRWGLFSVALSGVTMLAVGWLGIFAPEMMASRWTQDFASWSVITINFVMVDLSLTLALGAVISVLERALAHSVQAREAVEHERRELVTLNRSLEQEVRERALTEESLRESKALLRIAGTTARLGGFRMDLRSGQVVWSDELCELHEVPAGTVLTFAAALAAYAVEWHDRVDEVFKRCIRDGTPFDIEAETVTAKGNRLWIRTIGSAVRGAGGRVAQVHGSAQDISQGKAAQARHDKLEQQFRQAQKMETFGNLAGGVAHDFNNLMSVVLSYSEMLADELPKESPMRADLEEIRGAGKRAAELTRQLLAFSRQQVLEPKVVDLAEIVTGMEKMLRRLIAEDVELTASCALGLGTVRVDPGQIEQVIMNLVVNARDAMPRGGMITIETAAVTLDAQYAAEHVGVSPGPHAMLAVSDTGTGMDKETQSRMFEPFFTTKEKGKGTGLGLATVFGIVQQSGGTIWVYSEPGKGTTFKIYFPLAGEVAGAHPAPSAAERGTLRGAETVLLTEDDDSVRVATRAVLRRYGYDVLEARSGGDALVLCEQHQGTIHLLLTDLVMPRMSGRLLAERLYTVRPEMKVLYMSGYTDDAVVRHGILDATLAFIQKPISPATLARKVRAVLDA